MSNSLPYLSRSLSLVLSLSYIQTKVIPVLSDHQTSFMLLLPCLSHHDRLRFLLNCELKCSPPSCFWHLITATVSNTSCKHRAKPHPLSSSLWQVFTHYWGRTTNARAGTGWKKTAGCTGFQLMSPERQENREGISQWTPPLKKTDRNGWGKERRETLLQDKTMRKTSGRSQQC